MSEDLSKLREFAIAGGYKPDSILFCVVDEEVLRCTPDRVGAKMVNMLSGTIGFPKLESELSNYPKQLITASLVYSNSKVQTFCIVNVFTRY